MANPYDGIEPMKVLDHGYVRLRDFMGDDLTPVNAAKVSFDKSSEEFGAREQRLTNFLAENEHTSPFRHAVLSWEIYAPLFVKNQWWKYIVGHTHDELLAWNESSRRYVTEEPVFYMPEWRWAPENKKQGSGDAIGPKDYVPLLNRDLSPYTGAFVYLDTYLNAKMGETITMGLKRYNEAIAYGVAPEQARVFLPAYAMYVRWWWTGSLQGVLHLIDQRTAPDAQWEFQEYARVVEYFTRLRFPAATQAMLGR